MNTTRVKTTRILLSSLSLLTLGLTYQNCAQSFRAEEQTLSSVTPEGTSSETTVQTQDGSNEVSVPVEAGSNVNVKQLKTQISSTSFPSATFFVDPFAQVVVSLKPNAAIEIRDLTSSSAVLSSGIPEFMPSQLLPHREGIATGFHPDNTSIAVAVDYTNPKQVKVFSGSLSNISSYAGQGSNRDFTQSPNYCTVNSDSYRDYDCFETKADGLYYIGTYSLPEKSGVVRGPAMLFQIKFVRVNAQSILFPTCDRSGFDKNNNSVDCSALYSTVMATREPVKVSSLAISANIQFKMSGLSEIKILSEASRVRLFSYESLLAVTTASDSVRIFQISPADAKLLGSSNVPGAYQMLNVMGGVRSSSSANGLSGYLYLHDKSQQRAVRMQYQIQ